MIDTTFLNADYQMEDSETILQGLDTYEVIEVLWESPEHLEFFIPEQELKDVEVSIEDTLNALEIEGEYNFEVNNSFEENESGVVVTINKLLLED